MKQLIGVIVVIRFVVGSVASIRVGTGQRSQQSEGPTTTATSISLGIRSMYTVGTVGY